jgi:RNA polymerase sigma-70 factor (ECF subfamily)
MPPSDAECVRSCLDGHPEAFRHLVARYQTSLTRHLRFHLGEMGEALEVAQETFVRAYFALGNLRKPEAFFSWLLGIADRVCKETRRAALRHKSVSCDQMELAETTKTVDPGAGQAVTEAVGGLPDAYREVIVLRFYGGHSCADISRDLGVPLGTVTKRLSRAYALLREQLAGRGGAGSEVTP